MVALCRGHHDKADAGSFTKEQLRKLKATGWRGAIAARFDWRRQALLAIVGGSFYYEPTVILRYRGANCLFFTRDEEQNLLLNLDMPSSVHEPRLRIQENFWILEGDPKDLRCPPSGKTLEATYKNGERVVIRFSDVKSADDAVRRYRMPPGARDIPFPITTVSVTMNIPGTDVDFSPHVTHVGEMRLKGGLFRRFEVALDIRK